MRTLCSLSIAAALAVGGVGEANAQAAKIIGSGIGAIVGRIAGKEVAKELSGKQRTPEELGKGISENRPAMDAELDKFFVEMRKTLPIKFNDASGETIYMTNLVREGGSLFYVYVQTEVHDLYTPQELAAEKADMAVAVCTSKDMKAVLLGGYGVTYLYYNPDRKTLIDSVAITKTDCAS